MKYFLLLFLTHLAYSRTQVSRGVAKYQGQIVYHELRSTVFEGPRPLSSSVTFTDPQGSVIGKLDSDFSPGLGAPVYLLQDLRADINQGLYYDKGQMIAFVREKDQKERRKAMGFTASDHTVVAGEGLIHFIALYLEEIIARKEMGLRLVIPGRLDDFEFILRVIAHNSRVVEIELLMKNLLLRLFSVPQRFIYDLESRRLLSFEGLSPLRNSQGEMMSVDVMYETQN